VAPALDMGIAEGGAIIWPRLCALAPAICIELGGESDKEDSDEDEDFPSPVSLLFEAVAPFSKDVASSVRSLLRWLGGEVGGRRFGLGLPMLVKPVPAACLRARSFAKIAGRSLYACLIRSIIASREGLDIKVGSVAGKGSRMGS
jgi:hypothetical protein